MTNVARFIEKIIKQIEFCLAIILRSASGRGRPSEARQQQETPPFWVSIDADGGYNGDVWSIWFQSGGDGEVECAQGSVWKMEIQVPNEFKGLSLSADWLGKETVQTLDNRKTPVGMNE